MGRLANRFCCFSLSARWLCRILDVVSKGSIRGRGLVLRRAESAFLVSSRLAFARRPANQSLRSVMLLLNQANTASVALPTMSIT